MTDPGPWGTGRPVQVERKILDDAQLRLELQRLVAEEVGRSINERICETTSMVSSDEVIPIR